MSLIHGNTKIRILHLIHELGTGGAENGIINLANRISRNRFDLGICVMVGNGSQTYRLDSNHTMLFELDNNSLRWDNPASITDKNGTCMVDRICF